MLQQQNQKQKKNIHNKIKMDPEVKLKSIEYLICIHIQATCSDKQQLKPCQQTIEVNAALIHVAGAQAKHIGKFHQFVKPKCNPKLSNFCTQITGIKNQQIKDCPDIDVTLKNMENWIKKFQFLNQHNYTFITWGDWTLKFGLLHELKVKKLNKPIFINSYTNLKRIYNYQIENTMKINTFEAAKRLQIDLMLNQQQSKGQQITQNIESIAIFLYNNGKFKPNRKFVTVLYDIPNVNVTQNLEYLLVLDFQATCQDNVNLKPCSQIIEFPVMVIDLKNRKIINQFHEYVTPTYNPKLTKFCTELTGITQQMVTDKLKIQAVLQKFDKWINDQPYLQSKNFTFVTCGNWDLCTCLKQQAKAKKIQVEQYLKNFINIKNVFKQCLPDYDGSMGMMGMLQGLKIPHEGRHHSGIDDVLNTCNICIKLLDFNGFKYKKSHIHYIK